MKIVVIGAGASGLVAALQAAWQGANVTLFERNDSVGRKLTDHRHTGQPDLYGVEHEHESTEISHPCKSPRGAEKIRLGRFQEEKPDIRWIERRRDVKYCHFAIFFEIY